MAENLSTSSSSENNTNTINKKSLLKDNIKGLFKIIIFIILLIPPIIYIGNKYSQASTENLINTYNEKRFNEFYSLEKNSLNTVFLGSSHSYCTFDPLIFKERLGINAYQMGMPLQHLDSTYYTLKEVLNYQSPKNVVLEVYWDMLDDDFELKQATMLFQVMKNKDLENEYIKEVFPPAEKIKYNNDIFRFQADYFAFKNNEYKTKIENKFSVKLKASERQVGTEEYRSLGYTYCDYHMLKGEFDKTNQFRSFDGKDWKESSKQIKYLNNIIALCKEKNINLIFVTAPVANVSFNYIKNYDIVHNKINKIAEKNGIKYYDYNLINQEEKLLTNDNFRDDAHLNHSGVEIVDNNFIDKIKDDLVK